MILVMIRMLQAVVLKLPSRAAHAFGKGLGLLGFHVVRFRRRHVEMNIATAFGLDRRDPRVRSIARANFIHYGLLVVEILRLPRIIAGDLDGEVTFRGLEHLDAARAAGRGVLVLTAHLGNYDQLAVAVARTGYPVSLISKKLRSAQVERFWMKQRAAAGLRIFTRHDSPRGILRALKENQLLGVILDQHAHRPNVIVEFFGRPAATMISLASLARSTGAAVVPVFTHRRDDGTHVVEALPPVPFEQRASREETLHVNTQRYTRLIEDAIRKHPEQWTWIHRRWKVRGPGGGWQVAGDGVPERGPGDAQSSG